MTPTQAQPPHLSSHIQLTALPPQPRPSSYELSSRLYESTPSSQDPESCIPSIQARTQQKSPIPPRLPSCNPLSRKIARLTFQAMLVFGILNVMYQTTSLVPAFRSAGVAAQALGMQGDTARDGRQTLTYGFLQECGNRKAQSLPLGKDCVKYLTKTPKAPLDIDDWMEDNNEAAPNSTSARLRRRDIGLPASYVDNDVEASAAESPTNFRLWLYIDLICVIVVVVCMGKSKESRLHMQLIFQETKLFIWHKMDKGCRRLRRLSDILQSPSDKTAESIRIIGFILYTLLFIFMFGRWIKQQWRWKVASEFITQCKSRIENNELLGEDCTKYTGKKLKPQPEFEMNWWELSSFIFALLFILVKLFTNTRIALDVLRLTLETLGLRRQRNPRDLGRWPI